MTDSTTTPTHSSSTPASAGDSASDSARDATRGPVRATVRVPGPLRELADGAPELVVSSATVGAAVDEVLGRHPGLRRHLRSEAGALREHVNLFLNEEDVRYLEGEDTVVRDGDVVTIVPSIAGG